MTLKSVLGRYDRKLRRYCKRQLSSDKNSDAALVILENISVLSSAINSARGFLSRYGDEGLLPLFFTCRKFLLRDTAVSAEGIIAYFSALRLPVLQCEALPYLLFAAGAGLVCECLTGENKKEILAALDVLTRLRDTDFSAVLKGICRVDKYLREDPAGVYEKMTEDSRRIYRLAVKRAAEKDKISEIQFVKKALEEARSENRHVGFCLPVSSVKKGAGAVFVAFQWVLSAVIGIFSVICTGEVFIFFVLTPVIYYAIRPFADRLSLKLFPPRELLSLEPEAVANVPLLICVCTMLADKKDCEELYFHLKRLRFSTANKNAGVVLLCDRKNSFVPERTEDDAELDAVKSTVDRLNRDFGGGFSLFVRDRVFSVTENEYTGFERKRGAICELCRYVKNGEINSFGVIHGDIRGVRAAGLMLTLDGDTEVAFDTPDRLLAAALHPLNRPRYSEKARRITSGYGIISPRIEVSLEASSKSLFSRLHTVGGGVAYAKGAGERHFNLFGEAVFCGKGLIDIDAFYKVACDRFDEGRILSHDVLEGAVLRTGYSAVSEVCESFPSTLAGYYSRLHRWIRGDIQNMKYLFCPLGEGGFAPRISAFGGYAVAENLLSASAPAVAFMLIVLCCIFSSSEALFVFTLSVLSVISCGLCELLSALAEWGHSAFSQRYACGSLTSAQRGLLRALSALALLGAEAFIRADAVCRAAFRCIFSKKRLLQWKTAAAADSGQGKEPFFFSSVTALYGLLLLFSGHAFTALTGAAVLVSVPFIIKSSRGKGHSEKAEPDVNQRKILMRYIADAWRFFSENVTEKEHFLPPDNVWEQPADKKTSRTSPTNIGLYLTSVLAVYDVGIIDAREVLLRVNKTLDTLDALPKYKGQLYNWYDTERAEPVKPCYVSAVDCGNFLVCLTALKEGLREIDGGEDTASRIEKILSDSDLSFFADKRRSLFRIGFDTEKNELTPSCYDLYMSEARMGTFFAVARRQVDVSYWENLGRAAVKVGNHVTPGSWSGTMFEYFMPALFLHYPACSFGGEGLRVSLEAQRRAAEKYGIPYGFSESCFYDEGLPEKYGYKALGADETGLKPDMKELPVVSPYSSFLSLLTGGREVFSNLAWLERLGVYGKYGFYEAADFCGGAKNPRIIRCFMAHHTGMSIVAAVNFLCDGIFVKRFMRDRYTDNARGLLYEKLPDFPHKDDKLVKKCRKKL